MTDTFDSLRPYLSDYLQHKGINIRKRFRCLNPEHLDRNPAMGYDAKRHKVHCFACGADYDLFDLLIIDENLSSPREALAFASRLYGNGSADLPAFHRTSGHSPANHSAVAEASESGGMGERQFASLVSESNSKSLIRDSSDMADYLTSCFENRTATDYFVQRGLSDATVERFRLGYDPETDCVVLPCDDGSFVRRGVGEKRYYNEKGKPSPLFQSDLLTQMSRGGEESPDVTESTPVFIVEGVFDALSIEELGYRACAMNGAGNREKIAGFLRKLPENSPVLLLPDNDRAGEEWASALCTQFPWLYRCPVLPTGKDINEFLLADRDGAAWFLQDAVTDWEKQLPPPYDQTSALGQMEAFAAYIEAQAKRPALKTGFEKLDKALDGGLYDGLYVIGAVSSLGKTAFCMQMSDQLAQQGHDVLIFSLEMMAYELMARSISRETFQLDTSARRRMAKTVRGVLDGKRYPNYTAQEKAHLELATTRYGSYAGHLYFREGDHETGLDYIRSQVERHIAETGQKPVVLIDYLQIIAPVDVHFTDKQNLDRIVCALKKLSRELELTIFAISSFNRENYNLEVSMAAFKESGGIDYSADVLMGLQARGAGSRTFNIDEEKRKDPRELELKILKNRSAAVPEPIPFRYYPAFSCFEEV